MPYCHICNRTVEVTNVNKFPDYEESVFDCGHTSKLYKRSIFNGITLTENIEVIPKKGEKIPVTISGDSGAKIQGDLAKINLQIVDNKPIYYNVNITLGRS